jgi:hypothetical protein
VKRLPILVVLRVIDTGFAVAEFISGLFQKKKAKPFELERRARAEAKTVVLPRPPRDR